MEDKFIVLNHSMIRRKDLTMQEKIVYIEILNLSSLEKGCIASNSHFERCFDISKKSVSNTISSLIKKGIIESKITNRNHSRVLSIKDGQVSTEDGQASIKHGESKENILINKTVNNAPTHKSNNNKLYNEYLASKETTKNEESLILDYLAYRKDIKKVITTIRPLNTYYKVILELHNKGYDIKKCIDLMKNNEWQTIKEEYIKNSDLFPSKEWK
tara:strand:- start:2 stop:646 length:645 start_codon:yes stop_codon:yes gene_type:complete